MRERERELHICIYIHVYKRADVSIRGFAPYNVCQVVQGLGLATVRPMWVPARRLHRGQWRLFDGIEFQLQRFVGLGLGIGGFRVADFVC